ncbi:hypothetical protein CYLTODRAFT_459699 [Cylindrobasidium torrendii FP15055 ss-10]|uniref:SPX domain-containing protein n=1 Tax=Cylindrobasidium torrendii FP15055 ss-10 TaxID=1314674 RepID=A0A0D7AUG3_9AGAR|nr:hypothetical protein CYLTODRAFT_459699 [Cylindrobasidium torrendii FP15055 ss-10]
MLSQLLAQMGKLSYHKAILEKSMKATPSWRDVFGKKSTPPASDSELSSLSSKDGVNTCIARTTRTPKRGLGRLALELLQNYRVLNLTGFRKILKKTKIPLADVYTAEKVEQAPFATDKTVETMIKELESVYVAHFAGGNRKQAIKRLKDLIRLVQSMRHFADSGLEKYSHQGLVLDLDISADRLTI